MRISSVVRASIEDERATATRSQGIAVVVAAVALGIAIALLVASRPSPLVTFHVGVAVSAIGTKIAVRRRWLDTRHAWDVATALIASALALGVLIAHATGPDWTLVMIASLQIVVTATLVESPRRFSAYASVTVIAWGATNAVSGTARQGLMILVAGAVGILLNLAQKDRQRRRASAHAAGLEDALAHARRQVADKERAERDSEHYREQLLHAQKMEALGALAGGIAHDMNNALGAILGFADCISEDAGDERTRRDAGEIALAATRAAELTRSLLDFSRRGAPSHNAINPDEWVSSLVSLLQRTLPKGVVIATSFADALPAVAGDASQLSHALVNLCINASDAMGGVGLLTIRVEPIQLELASARSLGLEPGKFVGVAVRDTGPGVDAAVRARIFEPFFTTKEVGRGTGLGLAMVHTTMKRHAGAITVESEPGQGATFQMILPALRTRAVTAPTENAGLRLHHAERSVLVVDDEPGMRTMLARAIGRLGVAVVCVASGREAVAAVTRERFDLVLLDLAMPGMAGPEAFRQIHEIDRDVPVLLMSGCAAAFDTRQLFDRGAQGLIEKPFPVERLSIAIDAALRTSKTIRDHRAGATSD